MMKYLTILLSIYLTIFVNNLDVNSTNSYINSDELIMISSENYNIGCVNANILSNVGVCNTVYLETFKGCSGYVEIGRSAGHGFGYTFFRYYESGDCFGINFRDSGYSHAECNNGFLTVYLHYKIVVNLPGLPPQIVRRGSKYFSLLCSVACDPGGGF